MELRSSLEEVVLFLIDGGLHAPGPHSLAENLSLATRRHGVSFARVRGGLFGSVQSGGISRKVRRPGRLVSYGTAHYFWRSVRAPIAKEPIHGWGDHIIPTSAGRLEKPFYTSRICNGAAKRPAFRTELDMFKKNSEWTSTLHLTLSIPPRGDLIIDQSLKARCL